MTSLGTRDNATLRRLWADLEKVGGQYENGQITEQELLEQHWRNAGDALAAHETEAAG
jgi:hypothetical protein